MRLSVHVEAGGDVQGHDGVQHDYGGVQGARRIIRGEFVLLFSMLLCMCRNL